MKGQPFVEWSFRIKPRKHVFMVDGKCCICERVKDGEQALFSFWNCPFKVIKEIPYEEEVQLMQEAWRREKAYQHAKSFHPNGRRLEQDSDYLYCKKIAPKTHLLYNMKYFTESKIKRGIDGDCHEIWLVGRKNGTLKYGRSYLRFERVIPTAEAEAFYKDPQKIYLPDLIEPVTSQEGGAYE